MYPIKLVGLPTLANLVSFGIRICIGSIEGQRRGQISNLFKINDDGKHEKVYFDLPMTFRFKVTIIKFL